MQKYILQSGGRPVLLTGYGAFGGSYLVGWAINQSANKLAKETGTHEETVVVKIPADLVGRDSKGLWIRINKWVVDIWQMDLHHKFRNRFRDIFTSLNQYPYLNLQELTVTEKETGVQNKLHVSLPLPTGGFKALAEHWGRHIQRREDGSARLLLSGNTGLMSQYHVWAKTSRLLQKKWKVILGNYSPVEPPDYPAVGEYLLRARLFLHSIAKKIMQVGNSGFTEQELTELYKETKIEFGLNIPEEKLHEIGSRLIAYLREERVLEVATSNFICRPLALQGSL